MRVRRAILLSAVAVGIWALVLMLTGGVDVNAWGIRLSSHDVIRPAGLALALALAYTALARRSVGDDLAWAATLVEEHSGVIATIAAIGSGVAAGLFGTHTAAGSDPYGYVSQADLWLEHQLVIPQSLPGELAWPDYAVAPLGYRPGLQAHTIVPIYPPGLPLLMAGAKVLAGACGVYAVVPACAALAVWSTYKLGTRVCSRSAGAIAAILLACSPAFVFMSFAPMSDVPVAAAWTLAMAALSGSGVGRTMAGGLTTAAMITIRPNLAPLAGIGALALATDAIGARRRTVDTFSRLAVYTLATLPGVLFVAWLNRRLYGSPIAVGYGSLDLLFSWAYIPINVRRYGTWLLQSQTPAVALAIVPLVVIALGRRLGSSVMSVVLVYGTIAVVACIYCLYRPFDDWWWLRFWLPALPALIVAMVTGATILLRMVPTPARHVVAAAAMFLLAVTHVRFMTAHAVFDAWSAGVRFQAAGQYVHANTPSNTVVLAMEHSGSIRYYGGRMTVRYDLLDDLDRAVAQLGNAGYHPYLVLDSWEREQFSRRFLPRSPIARLEWPPVYELRGPIGVHVYDLAPSGAPPQTTIAQSAQRSCESAPNRVKP